MQTSGFHRQFCADLHRRQQVLIFSNHSATSSLLKTLGGGNRITLWVISGTVLGLLAITAIPMFAGSFAFTPTTWERWMSAFGIGASVFILFGAAKWLGDKTMANG